MNIWLFILTIIIIIIIMHNWSKNDKSLIINHTNEKRSHIDSSFSSEMVARVITSKNDQFIDPVYKVPWDSPITLCQQYGSNVC